LIGVVENMSYLTCPDCGKKIEMFSGKRGEFEKELDVKLLGELPMLPAIADITELGLKEQDEQTNKTIADIATQAIEAVKKDN
jgi:hypothetical protein